MEDFNLFRVATVAPKVHIGNVSKNCEEIEKIYKKHVDKADLIVTPELSLTGYTCADLFANRSLLTNAGKGIKRLVNMTEKYGREGAALIVGFPFEKDGELFNCAAMIHNGKISAVIPKTYLPNYGEFYEKRWFSEGGIEAEQISIEGVGETVFGNNVIIPF